MKLLILPFFFLGAFHTILLPVLKNLSTIANKFCVLSVPDSQWSPVYNAIVCGNPLLPGEFKSRLIITGLIHLIVVSGSHLIFLVAVAEKFVPNRGVLFLILGAFTLMTGLQPPTVRAMVNLSVAENAVSQNLFWTKAQQTMLGGLLTLFLFPAWASSHSFVMSWAASFALATNQHDVKSWRYHFWVYFVLFPIFLPLSPLNPISILTNLLFAPVVGAVLFPFSLFAFLGSGPAHLVDILWQIFDSCLKIISAEAPLTIPPINFSLLWLWVYLFALHIGDHINYVTRKRKPLG